MTFSKLVPIFGSFKKGSRRHQTPFLGCTEFNILVGKLVFVWSKSIVQLRHYYNEDNATQGQMGHKEILIFHPKAYNIPQRCQF